MNIRLVETSFNPDPDTILTRLGLDKDSDEAEEALDLLARVVPLAKPKAAFGAFRVDRADAESGVISIGGEEFVSKLMAKNLIEVETVWPYIVTCGRELYDFVQAIPDQFERYWGDEIMEEALRTAQNEFARVFAADVYSGKTAHMSPGSLEDWPIQQQVPLFRIMADGAAKCGVTLTDTMLMIPNKSISGIRFPNEHGYVNCRLCPKENCRNRQAPYDAMLV